MERTMYRLARDDDGHWYVIPADKENEWSLYVEAISYYWTDPQEDEEEPIQPEWATALGGGYGNVKFFGYEIE